MIPYARRQVWALQFLLLSMGFAAHGDEPKFTPPEYTIYRAGTPIVVDGKLDEPAWVAAPGVGPFVFTWYQRGNKEQTVAKLLWNDEYLYVACICQDAHITARHAEHDGQIPKDDCVEVMFAPRPDRPNHYFNIEWNVIGGYVDGERPKGRDWIAKGLKLAGSYVGTLNDDNDRDELWIVEAAIPFANFVDHAANTPPAPGTHWNLNLNRHGGDTNMQYSQWSAGDTATPNFHTPHRWGRVIFSASTSPFDPASTSK